LCRFNDKINLISAIFTECDSLYHEIRIVVLGISNYQCIRDIELYNIDAVHILKKCFQIIPL